MKGNQFRRKLFFAATALFLLACALPSLQSSSTPAPQALSPEQLGLAIEQTAAAAKTQTVTYLPPTLTPTVTRFPTSTPVALSSTPTFLYLLPTFTPLPTWTPLPGIIVQIPSGEVGSGNGTSESGDSPFTGKEWTCAIRGKNPSMGTVFKPGAKFYVAITLMNTGTKTWTNNGVDFVYTGGLRIEGKRIQDIPRTVAPGNEITLESMLIAPEKPDKYNTYWTLKVGSYPFCGVKYSFEVK